VGTARGQVGVGAVDHPATQEKKRRVLAEVGADTALVRYLPWDFESRPMADLPGRLSAVGHDASLPTLTLWEGVTMYLTPDAIDAAVSAVRALSAPGSSFVFTYFDRAVLTRPPLRMHVFRAVAARLGEPFRFGWDPLVLPAWLACRGFTLVSDLEHGDALELAPEARGAAVEARAEEDHLPPAPGDEAEERVVEHPGAELDLEHLIARQRPRRDAGEAARRAGGPLHVRGGEAEANLEACAVWR
jgi:O-methyltransferase involved in polyketide biosynthesis